MYFGAKVSAIWARGPLQFNSYRTPYDTHRKPEMKPIWAYGPLGFGGKETLYVLRLACRFSV